MENNTTGTRIPLRRTRAATRRKTGNKTEKSGFVVRLNIALTLMAAVLLLSRINTDITKKITSKAVDLITEEADLSVLKDKATEVFAAITTDNDTDDVFSEDSRQNDSDIESSVLDQIEQNKALEDDQKKQ